MMAVLMFRLKKWYLHNSPFLYLYLTLLQTSRKEVLTALKGAEKGDIYWRNSVNLSMLLLSLVSDLHYL
jgi:hypothetical protein